VTAEYCREDFDMMARELVHVRRADRYFIGQLPIAVWISACKRIGVVDCADEGGYNACNSSKVRQAAVSGPFQHISAWAT